MKKRRIIMFFAMIMSIAVIGVGFAAWIITAPTDSDYADGTISVDTVELHGWTFETYWVNNPTDKTKLVDKDDTADVNESKPLIVFGMPTTTLTNPWLNNDGKKIGTESLVAYLYVKGNPIDGVVDGYKITDSADLKFDFVKSGTVVENTTEFEKYLTWSISETDNNIDATSLSNGTVITITFNWKTPKVDSTTEYVQENPYTYYNKAGYSSDNAAKAQTYLKNLNSTLTGVTFKITLTAKTSA